MEIGQRIYAPISLKRGRVSLKKASRLDLIGTGPLSRRQYAAIPPGAFLHCENWFRGTVGHVAELGDWPDHAGRNQQRDFDRILLRAGRAISFAWNPANKRRAGLLQSNQRRRRSLRPKTEVAGV